MISAAIAYAMPLTLAACGVHHLSMRVKIL
jgi:hypothetical protein